MPRFASAKREPARLLRLVPKETPRIVNGPDLILTVDTVTQEYTDYRECTRGAMLIASSEMLNRRIGDVVPSVADIFDRAIWTAVREQRPVELRYVLGAHDRHAWVVIQGESAILNITSASRAEGTG